jgi:transposase
VLWIGRHRDWFGVSASVVHERFQRWRRTGVFEKLMRRMAEHYARERGGVEWRWQSMDSKHCPAPLGGEETGANLTDRGKLGAKVNLLVDGRGASASVVPAGANHHDKMSAMELIVSATPKRPARKERHLCADKAYDADDLRDFAASAGYVTHIKAKAKRKEVGWTPEEDSPEEVHPARRRIVERTISWLSKRRGLRARRAKKAGNWLALVRIACAHILLNLAVSG